MVIQNISSNKNYWHYFYYKKRWCIKTKILKENNSINYKSIIQNDKVSKISIVGAGMVSTPEVTSKCLELYLMKINILAITSEIKSVIINENDTLKAVKKLHSTFDLDSTGS